MTLLFAILFMGVLGLVLGIVIGAFVRLFRVPRDSRADLVLELLPGANCGGCGKAGCSDFARAVASGEELPGKCKVCSPEQLTAIALALGISPGDTERKQAVVLCRGDIGRAKSMNYNGVTDCASAALVAGGPAHCRDGCLGLGSCARKCPFGAIEILNGVAYVHAELCVGCGNCVAVCPRHVIRLVPAGATTHVYCNSREKGVVKRSFCQAGCIGCRKCVRTNPEHFSAEGFLAQVNYGAPDAPEESELSAISCPAGCIKTAARRYGESLAMLREEKGARNE